MAKAKGVSGEGGADDKVRSSVNSKQRVNLVEEWFDRWQSLIVHLLSKRLGDRDVAQDLSQEVYLRLLRVKDLQKVKNPRAYLCRVAVNAVGEWRLRARQRKPHSSSELDRLVSMEDLERAFEQQQTGEAVRGALENLPPTIRHVLVLHCRDDMTYKQIASHMGITRRMVKRYVAKGYAELRTQLVYLLDHR
jgi:RNA polymerase sigma factor (sigma-70 family)